MKLEIDLKFSTIFIFITAIFHFCYLLLLGYIKRAIYVLYNTSTLKFFEVWWKVQAKFGILIFNANRHTLAFWVYDICTCTKSAPSYLPCAGEWNLFNILDYHYS